MDKICIQLCTDSLFPELSLGARSVSHHSLYPCQGRLLPVKGGNDLVSERLQYEVKFL